MKQQMTPTTNVNTFVNIQHRLKLEAKHLEAVKSEYCNSPWELWPYVSYQTQKKPKRAQGWKRTSWI